MTEPWTISQLVDEVEQQLERIPKPANGQVRAVPDERTIRYYGTIGLLDRPLAMRGRTALYGRKHLAQVVAIKRLQTTGRSLAEIQELWSQMDDDTLQRMSGVEITPAPKSTRGARREFWKQARDEAPPEPPPPPPAPLPKATARYVSKPAEAPEDKQPALRPVGFLEVRVELAPNISLSIATDDVALTHADVAAIRAAAEPLIAELARRRLALHDE